VGRGAGREPGVGSGEENFRYGAIAVHAYRPRSLRSKARIFCSPYLCDILSLHLSLTYPKNQRT